MAKSNEQKAIRVDEDIHAEFKASAARLKRTLQDCADEALRQWLEEQQRRQEHDTG